MLTFSNPRLKAHFTDWPIGGNLRGQCKLEVEVNKKGQRAVKTTTNKHGVWCKPKLATYSKEVRIVDGSDGRTYIAEKTSYGFFSIMRSDFMQETTVHKSEKPEQHQALTEMFDQTPAE